MTHVATPDAVREDIEVLRGIGMKDFVECKATYCGRRIVGGSRILDAFVRIDDDHEERFALDLLLFKHMVGDVVEKK